MLITRSIWALLASAFFVCAPLLANGSEPVGVKQVVDGDTLRLANDQLLRFIGINTPERGYDGRPSQPYAEKASQALSDYLASSKQQILLEYGDEKKDRYGRLLGYPALPDGKDLSALLLKQGMGWAITIPPNIRHLKCYYAAETHARQKALGVWQSDPVIDAKDLDKKARGFHLIKGKVLRLRQFRRELYIELGGRISLRIPRYAQEEFTGFDWPALYDKTIEARGWINAPRGRLIMTIKHPAVIRNTEEPLIADLSACDGLI